MKRLAAALTVCLYACGPSSSSSLPPVPSPSTTDTFNGSVNVGGADFHTFVVQLSGGEIDITLTAVTPSIFMGVYVGTPSADGASCGLLNPQAFTVVQPGTTPQLTGTISSGTYCVAVYDPGLPGNQTAPVTYTVTVAHF